MTVEQFDQIRPVRWENDVLMMLDQRILPARYEYLSYSYSRDVADAIKDMVVRGAPAIGIAAAFAAVLSVRAHYSGDNLNWRDKFEEDMVYLAASRPTAVNLFWAIERMRAFVDRVCDDTCDSSCDSSCDSPVELLLSEAQKIMAEDILSNKKMGELGAELIGDKCNVLTHCNAGALATGGYGTALGAIRSAYAKGKIERVYADETRPWLQGSRLTAWELVHDGIPVTLQADSVAAHLMQQGKINWVIVGSDRIAANGDVANKIGTYGLAVLARFHQVKFMVVAPTSTIDMAMENGEGIPIEQRPVEEVFCAAGKKIAAEKADAWNPAFDVTPAALVDAIVTEKGVVLNPDTEKVRKLMNS